MDWIERLNASVDYIEKHLTENIDLFEVAKVAYCSGYHFQRMFSYMAEMTISEYIRKRRMSRAAVDLSNGEKVIDVALKYGYDSPTAFNRAFKSMHKVSPSMLKSGNNSLRSFTPIRFKITIKGAEEMDFKLVKKEAFKVVGVVENISKDMEYNFATVPAMWEKVLKDGTMQNLCALMDSEPKAVLGMSICNDDTQWKYAIAVASAGKAMQGMEEIIVPAATWAIFSGEGTNVSIQNLEKRIHSEWLPSSGYEYGDAPEIEVYFNADPNNCKYEVWLPVTTAKKN